MKATATIDWKPTVADLAEAFCELTDREQAQFFIECARIAGGWNPPNVQWSEVGRRLRDCERSTVEARAMVEDIAGGLDVE